MEGWEREFVAGKRREGLGLKFNPTHTQTRARAHMKMQKKFSDKQNARIEHDKALTRVMNDLLVDQTELYKQFSDNESFRKWLTDTIFTLTYYSDVINQQ